MKILILGGTGAMGKALVSALQKKEDNTVFVTSRQEHESVGNIKYIQGNAHDIAFLDSLLQEKYDAIVDFMVYSNEEFQTRHQNLLQATDQYIFLSSARVYAPSDKPLTEDSPRLLDVCSDMDYLKTNEYALAKAREENIIYNSNFTNFTIVRPSLTYNDNRLQLAIWEKEEWIYRAIRGRKIIFPKELENIRTTMSFGEDVSTAISLLIGNKKALGETIHIAGAPARTWSEILSIYRKAIENETGVKTKVYYADCLDKLSVDFRRVYQTQYARGISREFDNSKLESIVGPMSFVSPEIGLDKCVRSFLDSAAMPALDWKFESYMDKLSGDLQSFMRFPGKKNKLRYLAARFTNHYKQ